MEALPTPDSVHVIVLHLVGVFSISARYPPSELVEPLNQFVIEFKERYVGLVATAETFARQQSGKATTLEGGIARRVAISVPPTRVEPRAQAFMSQATDLFHCLYAAVREPR